MKDVEIRPLSELDQVDWNSFDLETLEGDERIHCEEIPDLLRRAAVGETFTGPIGNELALSLLDFYEYTMHLQFTPVMNEVLPFMLGILRDSEQPRVKADVLRFLAWAFTAAHDSMEPAYVLSAFDIEEEEDWDEDDDFSGLPASEEVQRVITSAQQFFAKLPEVVAYVQPFKTSEPLTIRGAATRFLFAAGVLQDKSTSELKKLLIGPTEEDSMLNLLELEHFSFNLYPAEKQRSAIKAASEQIFEQSNSLAVRWQAILALAVGDGSARNPVLDKVIEKPQLIEQSFLKVTMVTAREFHGFSGMDEYLEGAVLPTEKELGHEALPMALRFFSARMQSDFKVENAIGVMLALLQDFQRCQQAECSSYSVMYGQEILRRLKEIPASVAFERPEILANLDRWLELNDESFAFVNRGAMRHLLLYWLAIKLRSVAMYEAVAALNVSQ